MRRLVERGVRAGGEGEVGAGLGERASDGAAEAAAGAGDEGDLAGKRAGLFAQR
jgi:hypothetical protein